MKNKKKDFKKFTARSKQGRRSNEKMRRELMRAVSETNVRTEGAKIKLTEDRGLSHAVRRGMGKRAEMPLRGYFSSTASGFGFVTPEDGEGRDIFIPAAHVGGAIDGDLVEIRYHSFFSHSGEEKTEGRVIRILKEGRSRITGTVHSELVKLHGVRSRRYYVRPDDPKINAIFYLTSKVGVEPYDKVMVRILRSSSFAGSYECELLSSFGRADSKEANYGAILAECEIETEFTEDELKEAETVANEAMCTYGRVLRREVIFTIDSESAKDLDDAVSLRRLSGGGWQLGVHIADVSHYVREKTSLDRAVMRRGTSVYFTDKVVPMLPEALSNGACSLNPGEDKYTLSAIIDLDAQARITKVKLEPSVIKSRVKGIYSEINRIFNGEMTPELSKKYKACLPSLTRMKELYLILEENSKKRGTLELESDEAQIILDDSGAPVDIVKRQRGDAEKMIEQFMLTANEAVASLLSERDIPCVYRIHEQPPPEKLESFADYADSLSLPTAGIRKPNPDVTDFSRLLLEAEKKGLASAVSYTMLRAMSKAKYSDILSPHFGLGIEKYCHFTSPIRRLSDLATHRIIKKALFHGKEPKLCASYAKRAAAAATDAELRAMAAERRIENLYKAIYMSDRIGESFPAIISSVTPYGLFAMLENTCEGLIPMSDIGALPLYDEKTLSIYSEGKSFRTADQIMITVEDADITRGKLRFSLSRDVE